MEEIVLYAEPRKVIGKQVKALRRQGKLPAVVYGRHITPVSVSLNFREVNRILPSVSISQLVVVDVNGERHTTLVRERQRHPVTGEMVHVDFQAISLTEKLRTMVTLVLVGESPAVRDFNGIVVQTQEEIEVECLPQDLPNHIEVDLSTLVHIGDALHVRDLQLSDKIEILDSLDETIVLVTASVEEEEVAEEAEGEEEPEIIERGKKEEEEF